MFGFWNSASAISAAFFIDCAATPALPDADSGRINPTLTWPAADGGRLLRRAGRWPPGANGLENWLKALLHAGAGRQQRRAEHQANCAPPGRAQGLTTRRIGVCG